jgi:hypothetical protein
MRLNELFDWVRKTQNIIFHAGKDRGEGLRAGDPGSELGSTTADANLRVREPINLLSASRLPSQLRPSFLWSVSVPICSGGSGVGGYLNGGGVLLENGNGSTPMERLSSFRPPGRAGLISNQRGEHTTLRPTSGLVQAWGPDC